MHVAMIVGYTTSARDLAKTLAHYCVYDFLKSPSSRDYRLDNLGMICPYDLTHSIFIDFVLAGVLMILCEYIYIYMRIFTIPYCYIHYTRESAADCHNDIVVMP